MSEISQVGAFDAEIIETSRRIERLIQEHAPYTQIEDEQYKLSSLMNQKRKGIYQPKDPSYYVDQFIRCLSAEDRRAKAAELAEQALGAINTILEGSDQYDPVQLETFASVVEFFRFFSTQDKHEPDDDSDDVAVALAKLPEVVLSRNYASKVSLDRLTEALISKGYFTEENGRYFLNRFSDNPDVQEVPLPIGWERTTYSLTTMLTLAHDLGIIGIDYKKNPEAEDDEDAPDARALIASTIIKGFLPKNFTAESTSYRHISRAKDEIESLYTTIEAERERTPANKKDQYTPTRTTEELLTEYIRLKEYRSIADRLGNLCRHLDTKIIRIFCDLIKEPERQAQTP